VSWEKSICAWFLALGIAFWVNSPAAAFMVYPVVEPVKGFVYSDLYRKWEERQFWLEVGYNKDVPYLFFRGDAKIRIATVRVKYTADIQSKLELYVSKGIEWADVARMNKADVTKPLGCFGKDKYGICAEDGDAYKRGQAGFSFFATDQGASTSLVIDLIDENSKVYKGQFYFDVPEMKRLQRIVAAIPQTLIDVRMKGKKEALFK